MSNGSEIFFRKLLNNREKVLKGALSLYMDFYEVRVAGGSATIVDASGLYEIFHRYYAKPLNSVQYSMSVAYRLYEERSPDWAVYPGEESLSDAYVDSYGDQTGTLDNAPDRHPQEKFQESAPKERPTISFRKAGRDRPALVRIFSRGEELFDLRIGDGPVRVVDIKTVLLQLRTIYKEHSPVSTRDAMEKAYRLHQTKNRDWVTYPEETSAKQH